MSAQNKDQIQKQQLELRGQLWPKLDEAYLWKSKGNKGYTAIPRSMPLLLALMDGLSKNQPVSSTYLDLWCRAFAECFVTLNKPREMAFYAGFSGQRAEQTWAARMRILQTLGFIDIQPGPSGQLSYALILNPYRVAKRHREKNTPGFSTDVYNALASRVGEIRADDLKVAAMPDNPLS